MKISITLTLLCWLSIVHALITLESIRDLTKLTDEMRDKILGSGKVLTGNVFRGGIGVDEGFEKSVESMRGELKRNAVTDAANTGEVEDGDEVEDTVSAALKTLCSQLLQDLEIPLLISSLSTPDSSAQNHLINLEPEGLKCRIIRRAYHTFLQSTVLFLHEVQERQLYWQWNHESTVFDGVGWLQGLWASRSTNSQQRSFIEQQLQLYGGTGCFAKNEVLRSGVEVVEYLNDLLDSFA